MSNLLLQTDSYKLTHHNLYPEGTEKVYSYFESRKGARFNHTVFFGLQAILKEHFFEPIEQWMIDQAAELAALHFGRDDVFNRAGWEYILHEHDGFLPLEIKAVPEGMPVPTGTPMMTVENTDPNCWWLTNYVETILTHVWYPSTVATLSRATKQMIARFRKSTSDTLDGLDFQLHDFGYRGATCEQAAGRGGAAHLINFKGSDTIAGMLYAQNYYGADLESLAFSVPATEHSIMTSLGAGGEAAMALRELKENPTGIVACVADSYDIYHFVKEYVGQTLKHLILNRDGVFVVRPDSITPQHPKPELETVWILNQLWQDFGGVFNNRGYRVLDPHVRVLWGDGIDTDGIEKILFEAASEGFSAENLVFGMGGGLLQKVNRDTQRFAFKCSAQQRDGKWYDIYKKPLDESKLSKRGRFNDPRLETVYLNGLIKRWQTFDDIRERARI